MGLRARLTAASILTQRRAVTKGIMPQYAREIPLAPEDQIAALIDTVIQMERDLEELRADMRDALTAVRDNQPLRSIERT